MAGLDAGMLVVANRKTQRQKAVFPFFSPASPPLLAMTNLPSVFSLQ